MTWLVPCALSDTELPETGQGAVLILTKFTLSLVGKFKPLGSQLIIKVFHFISWCLENNARVQGPHPWNVFNDTFSRYRFLKGKFVVGALGAAHLLPLLGSTDLARSLDTLGRVP